jgi:hypothetical protein
MENNDLVSGKLKKRIANLLKIVNQTTGVNSQCKQITIETLSAVLDMIEDLKKDEIENSRIDFKEGYVKACLDMGEFFGLDSKESYPKDDEMEEINQESIDYINAKFKLKDEV